MAANAIYAVGHRRHQAPGPARLGRRNPASSSSQSWAIPESPDDLDDAWDELAPEPGADADGGSVGSPIGWREAGILAVLLVVRPWRYLAYRLVLSLASRVGLHRPARALRK